MPHYPLQARVGLEWGFDLPLILIAPRVRNLTIWYTEVFGTSQIPYKSTFKQGDMQGIWSDRLAPIDPLGVKTESHYFQ